MRANFDPARIRAAIEAAERRTSAEIVVSVAPFFWGDVRRAAEQAFLRLGISNTIERNGVLLFVVPRRRQFVVLGDEGIHRKVGQPFWERVADAMSGCFRRGEFTEGVVTAIDEVGSALERHFPRRPDDIDELPNQVDVAAEAPPRA